jgi:hypothetical protein
MTIWAESLVSTSPGDFVLRSLRKAQQNPGQERVYAEALHLKISCAAMPSSSRAQGLNPRDALQIEVRPASQQSCAHPHP